LQPEKVRQENVHILVLEACYGRCLPFFTQYRKN
jgi:hypothetical protein